MAEVASRPKPDQSMDCLDENAVIALLTGNVDEEQMLAIEEHLDDCPRCLELVALGAGNGGASATGPGRLDKPSGD